MPNTKSNGLKGPLRNAKRRMPLAGEQSDTRWAAKRFHQTRKPYPEPQLAGFAQVILNRQKLGLYANVRPVKLYPGVKHKIHGQLKQVWEPGKWTMS